MPEITHAQLAKAVSELAKDIARDTEKHNRHAEQISSEAEDTASIAEAIGAFGIDTATIGETSELATLMDSLNTTAQACITAGDFAVKKADASRNQNRASHTGIGEAAHRSPVGRGIFDVKREWFRQE